MQKTSSLYQELLRNPHHRKECRVRIAGRDYGAGDIKFLSTSGGAFSTPDIGNCTSRQIDLILRRPGEIPRQAEMRVFVRLVLDNGQASEWLPKGVFFISTRRRDKLSGTLTIHGFDAMLKSGSVWLTDGYETANWPMSQRAAVEDIARRMGVGVDPRTILTEEYPLEYPSEENRDATMTDILEWIAVCNAGNWVMSDEGNLLLLRFGDIPPETNYLVTEYGSAITLGGVRILVG